MSSSARPAAPSLNGADDQAGERDGERRPGYRQQQPCKRELRDHATGQIPDPAATSALAQNLDRFRTDPSGTPAGSRAARRRAARFPDVSAQSPPLLCEPELPGSQSSVGAEPGPWPPVCGLISVEESVDLDPFPVSLRLPRPELHFGLY